MSVADEPFSLQPTAPRHGRQLFARPLKDYQPIYETKERQIKNWVALGRAAQPEDLPPLDRPAEMPTWWARHYDRAVPEKLTLAAARAIGQSPGDVPPLSESSTPEKTKPTGAASTPGANTAPQGNPTAGAGGGVGTQAPRAGIADFDAVEGLSLEEAVARQRKALAVVIRDFEQALSLGAAVDESTISMRANRVDKALERLRKMEATLDAIRKSREELIDRSAAEEDLRRVHHAMASSLESSLVERFKLERAAVRSFVDTWFGALRQSRFFSATAPAATAAA